MHITLCFEFFSFYLFSTTTRKLVLTKTVDGMVLPCLKYSTFFRTLLSVSYTVSKIKKSILEMEEIKLTANTIYVCIYIRELNMQRSIRHLWRSLLFVSQLV